MLTEEELNKKMYEITAPLERHLGVKLLYTFQCIRCGVILDSPLKMIEHVYHEHKKLQEGVGRSDKPQV